MDDIRTAQERLELAERRLAALQEEGIDTAGLTSQLGFARRCLEDGRPGEVLAICEELLSTARRLSEQGDQRDSRPVRLVKSDRFPKSASPLVDSGLAAALNAATEAAAAGNPASATALPSPQVSLNAAALTEEVRKQVTKTTSESHPKTITTSQLREFVVQSVQKALADHSGEEQRIDARLAAALATQVQPTLTTLQERLDQLVAHPAAPAHWDEAKVATLVERLVGPLLSDLERRLEMRLAPQPPLDPTPMVKAAIAPLNARLDQLDAAIAGIPAPQTPADPAPLITAAVEPLHGRLDRLDAAIADLPAPAIPVDPAPLLAEALAPLGERLAQIDRAVAPLGQRLDTLETVAGEHHQVLLAAAAQALRAEQAASAVRDLDLQAVVAGAVEKSLAALHEELLHLSKPAPATPAPAAIPVELIDGLKQELARDLRADLDWQVEAMAAEKGWITLGDMKSEVKRQQSGGTAGGVTPPGFARLEAALVEFVNQTQNQQQKFLELLSREVEQRTAIVDSKALSSLRPRPANGGNTAIPAAAEADPFPTFVEESSPTDEQRQVSPTETLRTERAANATLPLEVVAPVEAELDALSISSMQRVINDQTETVPSSTGTTLRFSTEKLPHTDHIAEPQTRTALRPAESLGDDDQLHTTVSLNAIPESALDTEVMTDLSPISDPSLAAATTEVPASISASHRIPWLEQLANDGEIEPSGEPLTKETIRTKRTMSNLAAENRDTETAVISQASTIKLPRPATATKTIEITEERSPSDQTPAEPRGFEAALRLLVDDEVRRRVPETVGAAVQEAIAAALAAQEQRWQATLETRLAELPAAAPTPVNDPSAAVTALAEALGRHQAGGSAGVSASELATQLRTPAARQAILAVVATEAVENPGALAELTGLRAFLRREVQHASEIAARRQAEAATVLTEAP